MTYDKSLANQLMNFTLSKKMKCKVETAVNQWISYHQFLSPVYSYTPWVKKATKFFSLHTQQETYNISDYISMYLKQCIATLPSKILMSEKLPKAINLWNSSHQWFT